MPAPRYPVAYIRRSATGQGGDDSREFQTEAVVAMAGNDPHLVVIDSDWGRSGSRHSRDERTGFADLLDRIRRGEVTVVYAYSQDRLARDISAAADLLNACERHGTDIVTREGTTTPGTPAYATARMVFGVLATVNENVAAQNSEKRRSTVVIQKRAIEEHIAACRHWSVCGQYRLHRMGAYEYGAREGESLQAVIDAYVETRSWALAAGLLIQRGVPARRGRWEATTVMRIMRSVERAGLLPEGVRLPAQRHNGQRRGMRSHALSGLLRCPHDGSPLTVTNRTVRPYWLADGTRANRSVGMFCRIGRIDSTHPRPYSATQSSVLRWLQWAAGQVLFEPWEANDHERQDRIATVEARLASLPDQLLARTITGAQYDALLSATEAELSDLTNPTVETADQWLVGIDWTLDERRLNDYLRERIARIELDDSFRPVAVIWRQPVDGGEREADGWRLEYQPDLVEMLA